MREKKTLLAYHARK